MLYSISLGSLFFIINPAYKIPLYLHPSCFIPLIVGSIILLIIFFSISSFINKDGEYAPIPPVFNPVSPSPTLL